MQGLRLFASNRLEVLANKLAEDLNEPLSSPFAEEIIVVQSRGMEHWLSMQLARKHGICSNCSFPFPNAMMSRLFRSVLPDVPESSVFDIDTMSWKIMDLLPGFAGLEGFESIASYLEDDAKGVKLYQLATCLAEVYDSYVVFRPEMVLGWNEGRLSMPDSPGKQEHWQSLLWKAVSSGHEQEHPAALRDAFLKGLSPACIDKLPERVSLFGISHLPPFYLEVFHALSFFIPVSFYLLNPCRQYWGDIRSKSEIDRMTILSGEKADDLYLEEGNSLLAALGAVGRDLFDLIQDFEPREIDAFRDVQGDSLLEWVQGDILDLANPRQEDPRVIPGNDCSVQIHSCYSAMREVEVLRDNLLALFEKDPDLRPEDIVVMSPDIESYTPYIQAVFDVPRQGRDYIPFTIVDRSLKTSSVLADILLAVFDLSLGRFEASKVVSLLEAEPLRKKFGLREEDLETVNRWVQETGIRWGLDAAWKREWGLPEVNENTWSFGLDRLLLGYAMPSQGRTGFGSILPYDDIEGDSSGILGSFVTFLTTLFECIETLKKMHSLEEWSGILTGMFDGFFEIDDRLVPQANTIRSIFRWLACVQDHIGFNRDVSLEVVRTYVRESVQRMEEGRNFLSGGATFCAMLPMRSIPFKVVCMLGMNHADFPRQLRAKGFDLIAHMPRRGDCSRRNMDLYLFLEALVSARRVLYVSYIGQNMQDNSIIPPCTPVSTLVDYLDAGFRTEDGRPAGQALLKRHPLQAFSARYFSGDGPLFSYSRENAAGASEFAAGGRQDRVFMSRSLPEPEDEWKTIDIDLLCEFYRNPSKFLLTRRFLMAISDRSSSLDDFEPVDLTELDLYRLRQEHITHLLEGLDPGISYRAVRMSGLLPHGLPGDILFSKIRRESESFVRTVTGRKSGLTPAARAVELALGSFTLTGVLNTYGPDRIIRYRPARIKGTDLFSAWIHHLVLCALSEGQDVLTCCIARDETAEFRAAEDCRDILAVILKYYWEGMTHPLPFFPQTSFRYADIGRKGGDSREERLKRASASWEGNRNSRGEGEELSYRICFQGRYPLDEEFEKVSLELFTPLLKHRRQG